MLLLLAYVTRVRFRFRVLRFVILRLVLYLVCGLIVLVLGFGGFCGLGLLSGVIVLGLG